MTVRSWNPSWTASGSHVRLGAGDHARVPTASSPTKVTAMGAVGCGATRSGTPFPSDATSALTEPRGGDARWPSTRRSTHVATWSSAASIGSNSGVALPRVTRSAPSTTGRWSCWPLLSSGWSSDTMSSWAVRRHGDLNCGTRCGRCSEREALPVAACSGAVHRRTPNPSGGGLTAQI
jgi:hypothetical protein